MKLTDSGALKAASFVTKAASFIIYGISAVIFIKDILFVLPGSTGAGFMKYERLMAENYLKFFLLLAAGTVLYLISDSLKRRFKRIRRDATEHAEKLARRPQLFDLSDDLRDRKGA